jgi:hypothetical protein
VKEGDVEPGVGFGYVLTLDELTSWQVYLLSKFQHTCNHRDGFATNSNGSRQDLSTQSSLATCTNRHIHSGKGCHADYMHPEWFVATSYSVHHRTSVNVHRQFVASILQEFTLSCPRQARCSQVFPSIAGVRARAILSPERQTRSEIQPHLQASFSG